VRWRFVFKRASAVNTVRLQYPAIRRSSIPVIAEKRGGYAIPAQSQHCGKDRNHRQCAQVIQSKWIRQCINRSNHVRGGPHPWGFYSHFKSKSDLYAEVLGCFFTHPDWKNNWDGVHVDVTADDLGAQIVRAYLSPQHFENVENSCPMVALPTDVARSGKHVKAAFEEVFCAMVKILEHSSKKPGSSHSHAKAIAALCIGGMVVARAMNDRAGADDLRDACMSVALDLGGWGCVNGQKHA
jgi:hypothetical protein